MAGLMPAGKFLPVAKVTALRPVHGDQSGPPECITPANMISHPCLIRSFTIAVTRYMAPVMSGALAVLPRMVAFVCALIMRENFTTS